MRDRSAVWLRVASVLALIHGVLHTIGGVFGAAAPGAQAEALAVMKANRFVAMGGSRTYWDFFFGYGLFLRCELPGAGGRLLADGRDGEGGGAFGAWDGADVLRGICGVCGGGVAVFLCGAGSV